MVPLHTAEALVKVLSGRNLTSPTIPASATAVSLPPLFVPLAVVEVKSSISAERPIKMSLEFPAAILAISSTGAVLSLLVGDIRPLIPRVGNMCKSRGGENDPTIRAIDQHKK